ncbi:MAG: outer membrane lipoprotein chaperone LolA [Gammaproteobacteria bacterium]
MAGCSVAGKVFGGWLGLLVLGSSLLFPVVNAETVEPALDDGQSVADRLREFQRQTRSLRGVFHQQLIESNGLVDEQSRSGDFWVERPDKIRWHYRQPYEQLIVADGFKVWLYDPDLEQVLVRDLDASGDDVAGLLLGSGEDIARRFTITELDNDRYLLIPLAEASAVEQVVIEFDRQLIVSLEVRDKLGSRSRFLFSGLQANVDITPERFQFTPPEGVDVVIQ